MNFRLDEYAHCANPKIRNIFPTKKGEYILLQERRAFCNDLETRT